MLSTIASMRRRTLREAHVTTTQLAISVNAMAARLVSICICNRFILCILVPPSILEVDIDNLAQNLA